LFGCGVTDYGDDDFEIVASSDRWRHMKKMGRKCDIVFSGDNRVEGGQIRYSYPMLKTEGIELINVDGMGDKCIHGYGL